MSICFIGDPTTRYWFHCAGEKETLILLKHTFFCNLSISRYARAEFQKFNKQFHQTRLVARFSVVLPTTAYSDFRLSLKSPGSPPGNFGRNLPTLFWYSAYSGYFWVEISSVSQVEPWNSSI